MKTNYLRFPIVWMLCTTVAIGLVLVTVANFFVYDDGISRFLFTGLSLIEFLFVLFLAFAVQKATQKTAKLAQFMAVLHLLSLGAALTIHIMLARNVSMYRKASGSNNVALQQVHNNQLSFMGQLNEFMVNSRKLIGEAKARERQAIRNGKQTTFQKVEIDTSQFTDLTKNYKPPVLEDVSFYAGKIKTLTEWLLYSLITAMLMCFGGQGLVVASWEKDENQNNVPDSEEAPENP